MNIGVTVGDRPVEYFSQLKQSVNLNVTSVESVSQNGSITSVINGDSSDVSPINDTMITTNNNSSTAKTISTSLVDENASIQPQNNQHPFSIPIIVEDMVVVPPKKPISLLKDSTLFVVDDFEGHLYDQLVRHTKSVISFLILQYYIKRKFVSYCFG